MSLTSVREALYLNELALQGFPVRDDYQYRAQITAAADAFALPTAESRLGIRQQPRWHAGMRLDGHCRLTITVMVREAGEGNPWQTIGTVEIDTSEAIADGIVTRVYEELPDWPEAPGLTLMAQLYFTKEYGEAPRVRMLEHAAPQSFGGSEDDDDAVELEPVEPLTTREAVLVKDTWNKALDWKDMVMQLFVERMLADEPSLEPMLGDFADELPETFFGLLDMSIRALQPHTETLAREAYGPAHPDPRREVDTLEGYAKLLAEMGLRRRHWVLARRAFLWAVAEVPYLRDYERGDLRRGQDSAMWRFWTGALMPPMFEAIDVAEELLFPHNVERIQFLWSKFDACKAEAGVALYRKLFEMSPDVLARFGDPDVERLSRHLFEASQHLFRTLGTIIEGLGDLDALLPTLHELGRTYREHSIPTDIYPLVLAPLDGLLRAFVRSYGDYDRDVLEGILARVRRIVAQPMRREERLIEDAIAFVSTIAEELSWSEETLRKRISDIELEIRATGTYSHSYEELVLGAQLAWRNSAKCIGRIQWSNMVVRDRREVTNPEAMFREMVEHLHSATAGGNIEIVMTVFRPRRPGERWGPRTWNQQLVRYACYELQSGALLGDEANLALTRAIMELGWEPPAERSAFDLLPLVIQLPGRSPKLYALPPESVLEVPIAHPSIPGFEELGLKWCAVPAISGFRLTLGGVDYTCAPFNGWFMGTEIARNLWERYHVSEAIAEVMGLDTSSEQTLWRDEAWLALNRAVLHSFQSRRISMVDHHTASQQFLAHDLREKRMGRECPAQWSWIVPPLGGSVCPVWHHEMRDFVLEPQYHYQADIWAVERAAHAGAEVTEEVHEGWSQQVVVAFGSESGTAERYAYQVARRLRGLQCQVMALDDVVPGMLGGDCLLLVVTSTYGDGKVPSNAEHFVEWLDELPPGALASLGYAVMGIGSSVYERFCAGGVTIDGLLARAGARRLLPLHRGDELRGQANSVREWMELVARVLGDRDDRRPRSRETSVALRWLQPHESRPPSVLLRGTLAVVAGNEELLAEADPGSRSTRCITFDAAGLVDRYEPGDHLAIYPINPPKLVERLCDRLELDPSARFVVTEGSAPTAGSNPYEVLSRELSLQLQEPFDDLLEIMMLRASDPIERHRLESMVEQLGYGGAHAAMINQQLPAQYVDLCALLDDFPSVSLDFGHLLELLPPLKPRLYSISSSPQLSPGRVRLTVGVVEVVTSLGRVRPGLCSSYLAGLRPGAPVQVEVRRSDFRLPDDPTAPLVMVGPGTGISPLIGFLEERQALLGAGTALGPAWLWFGCRNEGDFLYRDRLEAWQRCGVLSQLDVAFSRKTPHKVYVQHLMQDKAAELWAVLSDPRCHVSICGDAKMADDVFEAFLSIAVGVGGLRRDAAHDFFATMKRQRRYQADVWGVTLHVGETTESLRDAGGASYESATRWVVQHVRDESSSSAASASSSMFAVAKREWLESSSVHAAVPPRRS
ncbi:nitric oxide synthase oxygenase [Paraliomyxa miuraensis]|uniref:nitric oxide synthase oxygenase n=1 Tax=Paraliomyxa miuraensis TaxID=376150 RepID=UPI00224E4E7C|nr:nitric oxide synthase oxygenase [Paraliomyxa miuraensis]MCX4242011.1 nitric oxide synthase oxygenase [Paraliomyxa miuraensis]